MSQPEDTIARHLRDAHAMELSLVRVLQSQIALAPRGSYRTALEQHLQETHSHAEQISRRLGHFEHDQPGGLLFTGVDVAQGLAGQLLALARTPLEVIRGHGLEEKALKNAKDAIATEALEIATYSALERLAADAGDTATVNLAANIRRDEEEMMGRLLEVLDDLTDAVAHAQIDGVPQARPSTTGAADVLRSAADGARRSASKARDKVADAVR